MRDAGLQPDWHGWVWVRRGGLIALLALVAWAAFRTHAAGHMLPGEPLWLVALGVAMLGLTWSRRQTAWVVAFFAIFLGMEIWVGGGYAGAASLAAYGVLVDANSRPPKWFGPASLLFLVIADFTLNDVKTALASTIYLTVLSLFGQFIRVAFAGGRAQREASELSRRLEHMRLTQAVHDSAAARLGQVLLVARSLQSDEELTPRLRREVDILVDVAAAGASELRDALRQEPALPTSVSTLEQEWIRSLQVLRTSGFIVAESASPMTSSVPVVIQREMVRCLREATTNIGRHGKPGGRVAVLLTLDDRYLRLTCSNDTDDETPTLPDDRRRLGLLGMQQRVGAMGGAVEASADNGVFSLSVAFPLSPSADHSVTAHAKESIYAERSRGLP